VLLKAAIRPEVQVGFVFLLRRIDHQDRLCGLHLELLLGRFIEEPADGHLTDEIVRGPLVVRLLNDRRFVGGLSILAAENQEPVPCIRVVSGDKKNSVGSRLRALE
jgi:hypothetical protein